MYKNGGVDAACTLWFIYFALLLCYESLPTQKSLPNINQAQQCCVVLREFLFLSSSLRQFTFK